MSFDQAITDEFVAEAKEHLGTVEKDLLAIEEHEGTVVPKTIDSIFRAIHSIKGAAGFLGFAKIGEIAHVMETLLQMMREGVILPESQYMDGLLAGVDLLSTMLDDAHHSNEVDIRELHEMLSNLVSGASSPQIKKEMETNVSLLDSEESKIEFEISEFDLKKLPAAHTNLFLLKFDLSALAKEKDISPVALINELLGVGMIVDAKVETQAKDLSANLDNEPLLYQALYSTIVDQGIVARIAHLSEENVIEVNVEEIRKTKVAKADKKTPVAPKTGKKKVSQKKPAPREALPEVSTASAPNQEEPHEHTHVETIRIQVDILDELMTLAGELVLVRNQQLLLVNKSDPLSRGISQRLDLVTSDLQQTIMRTRMQPIGNIFDKLPRIVRDLSKKLDKKMEIVTTGNEVELDKNILESFGDPLNHLVRNCCDHGIETPEEREEAGKPPKGTITVSAYHEAGQINITIHDDGGGIDPESIKKKALENELKSEDELAQMNENEIFSLIMLPGFSTAKVVSDISGRGVGMDVVKTAIEQLNGTIDIDSKMGEGTSIHMRLPLTLAIIPCLVVIVDGFRYAIPQLNLEELVRLYDEDVYNKIECAGAQEVYRLRDHLLPMVRLNEVFSRPKAFSEEDLTQITEQNRQLGQKALEEQTKQSLVFAVLKVGAKRFGIILNDVLGTEEIVVKPMHPAVKSLGIFSGATVMGDGKVALILDIEGIAHHVGISTEAEKEGFEKDLEADREEDIQTVLLFKSGEEEQFAISLPLIRRIEQIPVSQIEKIGENEFVTIDEISTRAIRIDEQLSVSKCIQNESMLLLLPKHIKRPVGLLISSVLDVVETEAKLNVDSYMEDGLLGTAIVKEKMTLFIDIYRLIEKAEPDWFLERRKKNPPPSEKKHILLVEDAIFFRQLVKGYLEADSYEVTTAENGKQALEILHEEPFDLIISDIDMPVMDGWELMENVRAEEELREIPAMALTALDSESDKTRTFEVGYDAYEIKMEREQLLENVANLIQHPHLVA